MSRKEDLLRLLADGLETIPAMAKALGMDEGSQLNKAMRELVKSGKAVQVQRDKGAFPARYRLPSRDAAREQGESK